MKTKYKILLVIVSTCVLFLSHVVPCFALNGYKANNLVYRLNAPHRLILGDSTSSDLTLYTSVDIPQTLSTEHSKEVMYQYGGVGAYSDFIGGAIFTSYYNAYDGHHPFADSYSQLVVNQTPVPEGAYDDSQSWYPLGYGYDVNTLRRVFSPQDFSQLVYLWQADLIQFDWDAYYFDPLTSDSARNKNGISLAVSFVCSKNYVPSSGIAQTVAMVHKMKYFIHVNTDDNEVALVPGELVPTVLSADVVERPESDYNLYVVQLTYPYVDAFDTTLRQFYGTRLPYFTVTSFGQVSCTIETPPANLLGVGGMGISPMYSASVSTFTGAQPYSDFARSIVRIDDSDVDTVGLFSWLGGAVGGFLDVPLFGFFSLGDLLAVCLAIGVTVLVLKLFAGG